MRMNYTPAMAPLYKEDSYRACSGTHDGIIYAVFEYSDDMFSFMSIQIGDGIYEVDYHDTFDEGFFVIQAALAKLGVNIKMGE